MNFSRTHSITLSILGVTTLVSLSLWVFLALTSNNLKTETVAIQSEITTKTADSSYYSSVRTALKNSKKNIASIDGTFITKDDVPRFIDLLESKASGVGIKADFGSIDITGATETSSVLRVRITATGAWLNLVSFVNTLESLPYALRVENLSFSKTDNKGSAWNMSLELTQYIKPTF